MNKRGWLRIIEASIAAVIILGVLFYLYNRTQEANTYDLSDRARTIVDEIALNESMRYDIATAPPSSLGSTTFQVPASVQTFVIDRIHDSSLDFEIKLCTLRDVCGKSIFTGETYSAERIISSSIQFNSEPEPRKVRLFIWRRERE